MARKGVKQRPIPPALKAFALTLDLQYYSSKAYEYVRETFSLGLPHLVTIRKWCSRVDGRAGFSEEALRSLRPKKKKKKARKLRDRVNSFCARL